MLNSSQLAPFVPMKCIAQVFGWLTDIGMSLYDVVLVLDFVFYQIKYLPEDGLKH